MHRGVKVAFRTWFWRFDLEAGHSVNCTDEETTPIFQFTSLQKQNFTEKPSLISGQGASWELRMPVIIITAKNYVLGDDFDRWGAIYYSLWKLDNRFSADKPETRLEIHYTRTNKVNGSTNNCKQKGKKSQLLNMQHLFDRRYLETYIHVCI